jgi:hypothetical protein
MMSQIPGHGEDIMDTGTVRQNISKYVFVYLCRTGIPRHNAGLRQVPHIYDTSYIQLCGTCIVAYDTSTIHVPQDFHTKTQSSLI